MTGCMVLGDGSPCSGLICLRRQRTRVTDNWPERHFYDFTLEVTSAIGILACSSRPVTPEIGSVLGSLPSTLFRDSVLSVARRATESTAFLIDSILA